MGYSSRRDVSWLKWGFSGLRHGTEDMLLCPKCFAVVPEDTVNMSYGTEPDVRILPWMEHMFWHEEVQKNDFTFGWNFPLVRYEDNWEKVKYLEMKRAYKEDKTLPADFLEAWYKRLNEKS
jgi:hypothetical protein